VKVAIIPEEGKAIVGSCMDRRDCNGHKQGFYEVRPIDDLKTTNCRWIFEDQIREEEVNETN